MAMATVPDLEQWLADSNDSFNISLVAPTSSGLQLVENFHPKFTYEIFGEEEKIFGYKDLKISLRFRANDMRPNLQVSYGQKFKPIGQTEAMDVVATLKEEKHLPEVAFAKSAEFESNSQKMSDDWKPPGTLHESIQAIDGDYEIWSGRLDDPAIKQLNRRIQILIPLFIEGGSYIDKPTDEDDEMVDADRWTLYFLYKKQPSADDASKSTYTFVGYSSLYSFFHFAPPSPPPSPGSDWELPQGEFSLSALPCRTRLSQFLILPPFQGRGNGHRLYQSIFKYYLSHKETLEFPVENPNEAFDDLRDVCDLLFLRSRPDFQVLKLEAEPPLSRSGRLPSVVTGTQDLEALRRKYKIARRQFERVLEMHIMSQLPESIRPKIMPEVNPKAATKQDRQIQRKWELMVKQRLYRHNKEALADVDATTRAEKLHETLKGIELDYARLLAAYESAKKHTSGATNTSNGKRKLDDSDDSQSSKKVRVDEQ